MAEPEPHDVRLRRLLDGSEAPPRWPDGLFPVALTPAAAPALHGLLAAAFDDGQDGPFETWWPRLSGDAEFDPGLCFLVFDGSRLAAAAICWQSAFIKDLAVHPGWRRRGLGAALLAHVFCVFRARGAAHVDLKTNTVGNADAMRLYRRAGMVEVGWDG